MSHDLVRRLLVGRRALEAAGELLERPEQVRSRRRDLGRRLRHPDAAQHAMDVEPAQPEVRAHARLRGDRVEVGAHRLELLAFGRRVQVAQVEPELLAGAGRAMSAWENVLVGARLKNWRDVATRSASR